MCRARNNVGDRCWRLAANTPWLRRDRSEQEPEDRMVLVDQTLKIKWQGGCCFCLARTWFSHFVPLPPCWSMSQGTKRQQDAGLDGEGDREGGKSFLLDFYPPTLPLKLEPPWLVSNHKLWWMCVTYVALSKAAQQIKVLAGINLGDSNLCVCAN